MITLDHIKSELLDHFSSNALFDIELNDISVDLEQDKSVNQAVIRAALDYLSAANICKQLSEKVWILERPLNSWEQAVSISGTTVTAICNLISSYRDMIGNGIVLADPIHIVDRDIQSVIIICETLENMCNKLSVEKQEENN